ncbi:MAG TPA: serine--tRNA ligase [Marinilabiliales bacterium]|nr:MAG: serine--tRNA ligase [Bacteroidetes bacterium GWA2_40_14]OFX57594.1 MAG: serine--tRNA ligase [Bacteroidetes bacterium GWC2_40_13]OFX73265.1 MAG: serine--tRNA ligase [Bacteroidetes bacterium GWD2_40_43]OFX92120.1 MAG: serine--tRNA ligase [Bacteroidetes bacterium GWE2_40_63]OFY24310.1 MAG: serine--tRNA ligase [Bacteroidetes bacterium GWF2_40_13]OFZ30638.1 MAG: serine--tRNA ligase [Bacteroidetes bacterium RIFOXYC2_FULL_40_12]HAM98964.1 serine--tRNA ligase [Marinilabiliales bacterium]
MLTLKYIQENTQDVLSRLMVKNFDAKILVEQILKKDDERKSTQKQQDDMLAEINNISKEVGQLFKDGKAQEANTAKDKSTSLKEEVKGLTQKLADLELELHKLLVQLPNLPHTSVPKGKGADDNVIVRQGGTIPTLPSNAVPHWDLAKQYDIIDFELGVKITGAGFPVYKGLGSRLQRALINFFLDENVKAGFTEIQPPYVVNEASGFGTGQLPDKEGQMYHVGIDNLYLIPTAEVPVTNLYRDVILNAKDFPVKNTAYSACFRREAGSYGKDVRGLNRLHQFDKVEIVALEHPDKSYEMLESMVSHVETLVQKLGLPYRILRLCGGDMSFTSALTYDFEVYAAAQQKWLEVSSVSNFESYQANRLKLRYKDEAQKKTQLAHTLNGSALALPRIVAALLENNQTPDGIKMPDVLVDFCGFKYIK